MVGPSEFTSKRGSGGAHRVLLASVFLVAFVVMLLPPIVFFVLRVFVLEYDEYLDFVLGLPVIVIAYPGCLGGLMFAATIVDFIRCRGFRAAIHWRILLAVLLLGPVAVLWYWVDAFRRAARGECPADRGGGKGDITDFQEEQSPTDDFP